LRAFTDLTTDLREVISPSDPGTDAFAEMTMQLFKREDARAADAGREQSWSRLEEQLV